jgi:hypothetical protein
MYVTLPVQLGPYLEGSLADLAKIIRNGNPLSLVVTCLYPCFGAEFMCHSFPCFFFDKGILNFIFLWP